MSSRNYLGQQYLYPSLMVLHDQLYNVQYSFPGLEINLLTTLNVCVMFYLVQNMTYIHLPAVEAYIRNCFYANKSIPCLEEKQACDLFIGKKETDCKICS